MDEFRHKWTTSHWQHSATLNNFPSYHTARNYTKNLSFLEQDSVPLYKLLTTFRSRILRAFSGKSMKFFFNPKNEAARISKNVSFPIATAPYLRRLQSPPILLWEPHISQNITCLLDHCVQICRRLLCTYVRLINVNCSTVAIEWATTERGTLRLLWKNRSTLGKDLSIKYHCNT